MLRKPVEKIYLSLFLKGTSIEKNKIKEEGRKEDGARREGRQNKENFKKEKKEN